MKKLFSPSMLLYSLGEGVHFAPASEFSSSYKETEKSSNSLSAFLLPYAKKIKNALAKTAEQSAVLGVLRFLIRRFFTLRIRSLGVFFFVCGFLQIVLYFALSLVSGYSPDAAGLLFGVVQILLTLLCSFTRGDVADALKRSFLFRSILSPLLGVKEWQIPGGKSRDNPVWMLLWGAVLGILSVFVSPVFILQGGMQLALILFLFFSPEAGFLLCLSLGLFFPSSSFFFLLGISFVSFLAKCSVGKRSLTFSPMDLLVILFLLPFGTLHGQWEDCIFLFALYFLSSCLVRTLGDLSRVFGAVTFAAFFMSSFLLAGEGLKLFFPARFSSINGLETFFFVKPTEAVGCVFALALPMVLSSLRGEKSNFRRAFSFVTGLFLILSLFAVKSSAAWLAAFLGLALYVLFSYRSSLIFFSVSGLFFITVLNFLPRDTAFSFLSLFGLDADRMQSTSQGEESLTELFSTRALWLFFFFLLTVFFLYQVVRFRLVSTCASAYPYVLGTACSVAVFFALSVQSVQTDYRALILFLSLLALPHAATRASVREEVRVSY